MHITIVIDHKGEKHTTIQKVDDRAIEGTRNKSDYVKAFLYAAMEKAMHKVDL